MDLIALKNEKMATLDASIKALKKTSNDKVNAEKEYKILLRNEVLKLRAEGMPVGVIELTCYGLENVAEARLKRDIADEVLKANYEAIQVLKLELRLIENDIIREYGMVGNQL